jgi:ribonucleoside-diphosphate reductase alpha chain
LCTEIALPSYPDEEVYFDCNLETQEEVNNAMQELYQIGGTEGWYSVYSHLYYGTELSKIAKTKLPGLKKNKKGKIKYNFGEIFSCILGGMNFGVIHPKELEELMELMVRFLDSMIDYQDYAGVDAFEKSAKKRRTLGISPGNLFYLLAKHNADYDSLKAKEIVSEYMENMLYYGIKASVELAKEKGTCEYFKDTKYSDGITPLDTYNKNVDYLVPDHRFIPEEKWKQLKEDIKKYGMRNSTLLTAVPASNSSRVSNQISGVNPPQDLIYVVEDKKVVMKGAVPNLKRYKNFYKRNSAWNIDFKEYAKLLAVLQKYIDQAISINQYNDMTKYKDGIPFSEVILQDAVCRKYGIKSLYYSKTKTDDQKMDDIISEEESCGSGGCTL